MDPANAEATVHDWIVAKQSEMDFIRRVIKGKNFSKRMLMMVNQRYKSDVRFIFETESIAMHAHKNILTAGSPVFDAMFTGDHWAEKDTVNIVDIPSDAFKALLEYVYAKELGPSFHESYALDILYAAHKYEILTLEKIICDFLVQQLDIENVCQFYEASQFYDNRLTVESANFLKLMTWQTLKTDGFLSLQIETIKRILDFDELNAKKKELFSGLVSWSGRACHSAGLLPTLENRRLLLKGAQQHVRFRAITADGASSVRFGSCIFQFFCRKQFP